MGRALCILFFQQPVNVEHFNLKRDVKFPSWLLKEYNLIRANISLYILIEKGNFG